MRKIALGLMSGTSADGLTVCAVQIRPFKVLHFKNYAYPAALQQRLLTAFSLRVAELSALHFELGRLYVKIVRKFLKDFSLSAREIEVIGSHGQTVYHGPHDKTPNTLQIGEPSFLSAQIGCPVVSDFRPMDIALGGEGAPLIPFFDEYFWGKKSAKILLNVGGISNFSVVGKKVKTVGFDVGPGNTLIDLACQTFLKNRLIKTAPLPPRAYRTKSWLPVCLRNRIFRKSLPRVWIKILLERLT